MIRCNLHTHTTFCDGKSTPREMAEAALALGLDTLGFSGHAYTPFDGSFCLRDPQAFAREIGALKEEYRGRLHILLGAEWDLYGEVPYETDYVLGAVHYVKHRGEYYPIDHSPEGQARLFRHAYGGDTMSAVALYFETVVEMAERLRPDMIAHFDVITKFNEKHAFFDETGEQYLSLARQALDAVLSVCPLIEVNTGGVFRGWRSAPYPALPLLSYIKEKGGEVILSSDCHKREALAFGFEEALGLVRRAGFDRVQVYTPEGRRALSLGQAMQGYPQKN